MRLAAVAVLVAIETVAHAQEAATRAIEEGHGDPAITKARDPEAELRRRFEEEPAEWSRTEIEVDVDEHGELASIAVAASSGRRELDEEALHAVKRGIAAGMRIHFDETTGKAEPLIPFVRRVVTRVRIIDYAERK